MVFLLLYARKKIQCPFLIFNLIFPLLSFLFSFCMSKKSLTIMDQKVKKKYLYKSENTNMIP